MRGVRICKALLLNMVSTGKGRTMANRYIEDQTEEYSGKHWSMVIVIQRTRQAGNPQTDNNPGEVQTESKRQDEREIQDRQVIRKQTKLHMTRARN